jgi:hypothetical protein
LIDTNARESRTFADKIVEFAQSRYPATITSKECSKFFGMSISHVASSLGYVVSQRRLSKVGRFVDELGVVRTHFQWCEQPGSAADESVWNIEKYIKTYGHDEDFEPIHPSQPTAFPPGSPEKIAVMAMRVALGQSPWNDQDPVDFSLVNRGMSHALKG